MYRHGYAHGNRRGGWVFLAALIVIVIILVILLNTWLKPTTRAQTKPVMIERVERADRAAVMMNIKSMETTLQMMDMENPGKEFTIDELRAKLPVPASRSGGDYVIGTDRKVYFTGFEDTAPPPEMLTNPKVIVLK